MQQNVHFCTFLSSKPKDTSFFFWTGKIGLTLHLQTGSQNMTQVPCLCKGSLTFLLYLFLFALHSNANRDFFPTAIQWRTEHSTSACLKMIPMHQSIKPNGKKQRPSPTNRTSSFSSSQKKNSSALSFSIFIICWGLSAQTAGATGPDEVWSRDKQTHIYCVRV